MSKIGMIGGRTSSIGFRALGVETFPVPKPENAREVWDEIPLDDYGIILMTEPIYLQLKEDVLELQERLTPCILVIPAVARSLGVAGREINRLVEKAVGIELSAVEE